MFVAALYCKTLRQYILTIFKFYFFILNFKTFASDILLLFQITMCSVFFKFRKKLRLFKELR